MDGRFSYFVCIGDSMKQPVRVKLTKGETFVGVSYDNQSLSLIHIWSAHDECHCHIDVQVVG